MRRYPEAIAYAQRAIAIFPDNPFPYIQIAIAMAYMKDPASSEWARKAISKAPENGHCWAALSDTFNLQGKWAEGLEPMRKAVAERLLRGHNELSPEDFAEVRPLLLEHPNLEIPVALAREL